MKQLIQVFISILLLLLLSLVFVSASCIDGVDNDNDGYTDVEDLGCLDQTDASEIAFGYQMKIVDDIESICLETLKTDYGYDCLVDHLDSLSWYVTYSNPSALSSCLDDYSYGFAYDEDVYYSRIALADCVYSHYADYSEVLSSLVSGSSDVNAESYCLEVFYDDYSSYCVEDTIIEESTGCDESECNGYACDTINDVCYDSCTSSDECSEDAACVTKISDSLYGNCVVCTDSNGINYLTSGEVYGVNNIEGGAYPELRSDYCFEGTNYLNYNYCKLYPIDGHYYVATNSEDCETLVGAGSICSDGACVQETVEICDDGLENDGDGFVDCEDSDCSSESVCSIPTTEIDCNDYIDNDQDHLIDSTGGCDVNDDWTIEYLCGCDSDGDGSLDVYAYDKTCSGSYGCLELASGELLGLTCGFGEDIEGAYYLPDFDDCSSSGPSYAVGVEESFFTKFFGWLMFW